MIGLAARLAAVVVEATVVLVLVSAFVFVFLMPPVIHRCVHSGRSVVA
jgi:hypothetical protein